MLKVERSTARSSSHQQKRLPSCWGGSSQTIPAHRSFECWVPTPRWPFPKGMQACHHARLQRTPSFRDATCRGSCRSTELRPQAAQSILKPCGTSGEKQVEGEAFPRKCFTNPSLLLD
ncbi:PREDICTED: uncharacterized protein LOC105547807 [Mandrillus leucophaeus]|uniref:uncharacterized protein LOC105547807 n=1 Tax=Mandrillus leucophaeus TaxID=9568 RepID=UPI0005F55B9B|nr:PREDICTED: uncharacterized protein LOC105547807 [Mandrillus leucophaeus]